MEVLPINHVSWANFPVAASPSSYAAVVGWSVPTGADEEGRGESYLPISPPLANSPAPEAPGGPTVNIQTYLLLAFHGLPLASWLLIHRLSLFLPRGPHLHSHPLPITKADFPETYLITSQELILSANQERL